ncbi:hypothetical protein Nepgr_033422 [Nepenthes gracilis]|uniref:Dof zinc finger protein n=1 Tax=Nepenthes gracilis TaxID=150966 RepID=A0AAD3TKL2_NEPGR|nr:hypothetical protein Nepgr_033422 [Nepenthes gracilis]
MQNIQAIGGGIGGGVGSGWLFGDRRLRAHHQQSEALKCPRCDSIDTKFCYYNNYNLSQPRHLCKSCRRYWTMGGIQRNIPVGGGCRKSKRSKKQQKAESSIAGKGSDLCMDKTKSSSHSSNENTSNACTTPTAASISMASPTENAYLNNSTGNSASKSMSMIASESLPTLASTDASTTGIFKFSESKFARPTGASLSFETFIDYHNDTYGRFVENLPPFRLHQADDNWRLLDIPVHDWQLTEKAKKSDSMGNKAKMQPLGAGIMDQTKQVDLQHSSTSNVGLARLDLQAASGCSGDGGSGSNYHQGVFDLPLTVNPASWIQTTRWCNDDHPLYLPWSLN